MKRWDMQEMIAYQPATLLLIDNIDSIPSKYLIKDTPENL